MVSAFADHLRHVGRLPHTIRYTAQGLGRVRRSARKLSPELTRPFEPPPTFMNHKLTPERRFATATLALADVKGTGKRLGATINDMVLAMSTGALRTLLLRYDGQAQPLLASVPVSFDFSRSGSPATASPACWWHCPSTTTTRWSGSPPATKTPSPPRKVTS